MIKRFIKSILPETIVDKIIHYKNSRIFAKWESSGKPCPPPHIVKQLVVSGYQDIYKAPVLVETGTFLGDMVWAQKKSFKKIISIELGEKLWRDAVARFKKYKHITILKGDSAKILKTVVNDLVKNNERAIFWLNGHFSAGNTAKGDKITPILDELSIIMRNNKFKHVILIDDARLFIGKGGYPDMQTLKNQVLALDSAYKMTVKNDIIRLVK